MDVILNTVRQWLWILTNVWRWRGVGVAVILLAAVDEEFRNRGEALLPVVFYETAPLLKALNPGVEAVVSSASSIHTCAFGILTCAQEIPTVLRIWSTGKYTESVETNKQTYKHTNKQTNKRTNKRTNKHTHTHTLNHYSKISSKVINNTS